MNSPRSLFIALLALPAVAFSASTPPGNPPAKKDPDSSRWVFSLLPKSFQKNPSLDLTVITEMTEAGKKLPPVSPSAPAYFITQSGGFKQLGHAPGNEKSLSQEQVEKILTHSLATNGYLPAQPPATPPSIVIIYVWGSHNLLVEGDADNPSLSGQAVARNLLDRAALVGGEKFAKQMLDMFQQADSLAISTSASSRMPSADGLGPAVGPAQLEMMNPVYLFKLRNPKNEFLVDQMAEDVYYVVASAYDYKALTEKKRLLLWRTRMTVATQGVSQEQTLPTLIASAGPYFGKEMTESEILTRRVREGSVEVGTPTVVEPAATPAKK
jgi:hypothetical protein